LDEIQAAILRVKLQYLDQDNELRAQVAATYQSELGGCDLMLPTSRQEGSHVYHLYVVRSRRRDSLKQHLHDHGISALIHYPVPIHRQPAYQSRLPIRESFIQTERAAEEILSLPIYPGLRPTHLQSVIQAIRQFV